MLRAQDAVDIFLDEDRLQQFEVIMAHLEVCVRIFLILTNVCDALHFRPDRKILHLLRVRLIQLVYGEFGASYRFFVFEAIVDVAELLYLVFVNQNAHRRP